MLSRAERSLRFQVGNCCFMMMGTPKNDVSRAQSVYFPVDELLISGGVFMGQLGF